MGKNKIMEERVWKWTRGNRTKVEKHLYVRDDRGQDAHGLFGPGGKGKQAYCSRVEKNALVWQVGSAGFIGFLVLEKRAQSFVYVKQELYCWAPTPMPPCWDS